MKLDTWHDCVYDATLGEWFAITMSGSPVFGKTEHECKEHLREANRIYLDHMQKQESLVTSFLGRMGELASEILEGK